MLLKGWGQDTCLFNFIIFSIFLLKDERLFQIGQVVLHVVVIGDYDRYDDDISF